MRVPYFGFWSLLVLIKFAFGSDRVRVCLFPGNPLANGSAPFTQSSCLANLGAFGSSNGSCGTFGCYTNYSHTSGLKLRCQRWYAMFVKRMLHSKRHRLSIISQLLLPLFFMLIALINAKTFPEPADSPPLNLTTKSFGDNKVPYWAPGPNR